MVTLFITSLLYYKKYSETKKTLDYEVNDIRNLARPSSEMQSFEKNNSKYTNLSINNSTI